VLLQENFALLMRARARARDTPSVFLQRFASLSIQFSLCCYLSFVVVFFIYFLVCISPSAPPSSSCFKFVCSLLFIRDEGVTEERCRYGQGRQGTGLLLRYRQEDERYGSLFSIPFCAYVESLSLSLSLSLSHTHTHTHTHTQHKSAFCVFLFSLGWRNSLSRIVYVLCLLSRFFYVAIDCRFLSPHRRYALVLSASFPFDKNMKSRSEEKESRGHAHISFFEY